MVVVALVHVEAAHPEELLELSEAVRTALPLRHDKPVSHLVAGSIAASSSPIGLFDEADGEATLSINETDDPADSDQSFLLIFRTVRIVTVHALRLGRVPDGYSGFPAYSQMHL
jgi:hypothetical protein